MFGFLKPSCATRRSNPSAYNRYRQVYAAFCAHHRARHGVLASTLISYEAVFLYQLAIASGACSSPAPTPPTCCRLRSDPTNRWNLDKDLADFCSDFGMLLVRIKLEDDVRDSGSLIAKTTQRLLRKKLKQASSALDKLSKDQNSTTLTEKIDDLVQSHIAFENPGSPNSSSPVEIQQ
ncbi:MAG: DUF5685 family protein [Mariniblastus sp.]